MRSLFTLSVGLAVALAAATPTPVHAQSAAQLRAALRNVRPPTFPATSQAAKSAFEQRTPKVDPSLLRLADDVRSKGLGDLDVSAKALGIPVSDDMVLVTLHAANERSVGALEDAVDDLGGDVQAAVANTVFARVPANALERLGRIDPLYYAKAQGEFVVEQAGRGAQTLSDGVAASKIDHLHKAGVTGKGVKVGILDFGFKGLSQLVAAGEIQKPVATRAFNDTGSQNIENVPVEHGTGCAEIVHDMAPDAELYIAMVGTGNGSAGDGDIAAAAQWLADQDVDIISFSGGGQHGPHDGTADLDMVVQEIVAKHDVLWVNAAGNDGDQHWSGVMQDRDRDEILELDGQGTWGFAVRAARRDSPVIAARIYWDDWGSSQTPSARQDVDAYLFALLPSGDFRMVARSENPQNGRAIPFEYLEFEPRSTDEIYALVLRATRVTRPVRVHVYGLHPVLMQMEPKTPVGSIGIPGTAQQALAVGAVNVLDSQLERYSSQGPTDDQRLKPEVSAADNTKTVSYRSERDQDGRFTGTSAACPHVSGFAALLKQMNRNADGARLRQMVIANVRDMGRPGPDNEFGSGHIDGTKLAAAGGGTGDSTGIGVDRGERVSNVPEEFGSDDLTNGDFEELWRLARRQGDIDDLKVVTGRATYRVGDGLKVGIRSERDCNYMLVHRDSRGRFTVLAPEGDDARLRAGGRYALPENETWDVSEPLGQEGLMVACSSRPIELADWIDNPTPGRVWFATTTYDVER